MLQHFSGPKNCIWSLLDNLSIISIGMLKQNYTVKPPYLESKRTKKKTVEIFKNLSYHGWNILKQWLGVHSRHWYSRYLCTGYWNLTVCMSLYGYCMFFEWYMNMKLAYFFGAPWASGPCWLPHSHQGFCVGSCSNSKTYRRGYLFSQIIHLCLVRMEYKNRFN